jgi:MscS family membrane protein
VRRRASDRIALLALARRLFKIVVVFIAILIVLRRAGVDVTAMLAGLGLGGVALALAAQKTLESLLGGITIIMRKAVRVGDFCQMAGQTGTIEDVGLTSTRVRTLDRTLVSVPNAQIAQTHLENISMRDKFWFHHVFGVRYDSTPEQMRSVLGGIDEMLRGDSRIERDTARVQFIEFGASSLNVEIFAYIYEPNNDYNGFLRIQQELLLRVMEIVAESGTNIALPSQMTYLEEANRSLEDTPRRRSIR